MNIKEIIRELESGKDYPASDPASDESLDAAIDIIRKHQRIDEMKYKIYMSGVNMTDEYAGCWVRFKDIERIIDEYLG